MNCPSCKSHRVCGHEVRGVFDGVLYWSCMACGWAWERDGHQGKRAEVGEQYVAAIQSSVRRARTFANGDSAVST